MAKVLAKLRDRIDGVRLMLFSVLTSSVTALLGSYFFLPLGPMCLGTIDQCAYALSQSTRPPLLEGTPLNWILIFAAVAAFSFAALSYGSIADRIEARSGIGTR